MLQRLRNLTFPPAMAMALAVTAAGAPLPGAPQERSKNAVTQPGRGTEGADESGKEKEGIRFVESWRVPLGAPLAGPLLVLEDQVVVSLDNGEIRALSSSDGLPRWKTDLQEPLIAGPVPFGGRIAQATPSGDVTALSPDAGEVAWTIPLRQNIDLPMTPTRERLLVPLRNEELVSLDVDGKERWRARLTHQPTAPAGACRGFVVIGTRAGTVEAYDREDGSRLWVLDVGAPVHSPFLCHRGLIYFGTGDYRFQAIRANGRPKWTYKVGGDITAAPFADGRRVYFLSFDNFLYMLKARSGHLVLKVRLSHRLSADGLRLDDRLYLSPYTSARLISLLLPDLQLLSEYALDLEGEWFTTPPVRAGDRLLIGYGRSQGRILALKEELTPAASTEP